MDESQASTEARFAGNGAVPWHGARHAEPEEPEGAAGRSAAARFGVAETPEMRRATRPRRRSRMPDLAAWPPRIGIVEPPDL
jgi:hypothetical protein